MRIRAATLLLALLAVLPSRAGTPPFAWAGGPSDPQAPGVHIDTPDEGAVVGRSIRVAGHVVGADPKAPGVVRVGGSDVALTDGRFETTFEATRDGRYVIRVVYAVVGVPAEVEARTVFVDGTPPLIEVLEPPGPVGMYPNGEGRVAGTVADPNFRELRMNGKPVFVGEGGAFDALFVLPTEGDVRVEIVAVDAVGNASSPIVRFLRARAPKTPPVPVEAPKATVVFEMAADGRVTWHGPGGGSADLGNALSSPDAVTAAAGPAARDFATLLAVAPRLAAEPGRSGVVLEFRLAGAVPLAVVEPFLRAAAAPTAGAPLIRVWDTGAVLPPDPAAEKDPASVSITEPRQDVQQAWSARIRIATWSWGFPTIGLPFGAPPPTTAARARRSVLDEVIGVLKRAVASTGARAARLVVTGAEGRAWPDDLLALAAAANSAGFEKTVLVATAPPEVVAPPAPPPAVPPPAVPPPPSNPTPPALPPKGRPPSPPVSVSEIPKPDWLKRRVDAAGLLEEGGSARSQKAVETAIEWLAQHQSSDGRWECVSFDAWCGGSHRTDAGPTGRGKAAYYDVGVTGLALLAFLGAGYTDRDERGYAKTVAAGLQYLRSVQDAEGCFGPRSPGHFIYNHAIAAQAMIEAYLLTGSPIHGASTQKALDFIAIARNPYFGWRYGVKPGENDMSVTAWMVMALKYAKWANIAVVKAGKSAPFLIDEDAFDGADVWVDKMTDFDTGRVGYVQRGTGPARPADKIEKYPSEKSESMTAAAIWRRLHREGVSKPAENAEMIAKGAALCSALPPTWNPNDGSIDMYYWYYASLALFQLGGAPWRAWSAALQVAVVDSQRRDTDACMYRGSWDPIDPWGMDGGRVYSTAMGALILETYCRFPRGTK